MSFSFNIAHELPGRIRFRMNPGDDDFDRVVGSIRDEPGVLMVRASRRTGSILVHFLDSNARHSEHAPAAQSGPGEVERAGNPRGLSSLSSGPGGLSVGPFFLLRRFLPPWVRLFLALKKAWPFLVKGFDSLVRGRADLYLLDALAIGISLIRRDFRSVMIITTLLNLGEMLEHWTRKRSMENLARDLMYTADQVWVSRNGTEYLENIKKVIPGDLVVVRSGSHIPVDGVIAGGRAMVNQSSMTGEPLATAKSFGGSVYAGTVVEEGEIKVRVTRTGDKTRMFQLMKIIEESERLKSSLQIRAEHLADNIVPMTLLLSFVTFVLTRSISRAVSVLMVDYSCAIKLSTPLTMLSAMRQASHEGVAVKGGKYLEMMNRVDTFVFDKTGTLTQARPRALEVVTIDGFERREVLRMAACLEEHFPHPVASAVVDFADREGIVHHEQHSTVRNVLAHGILSTMEGREIMVGSRHFVEKHGQVDLMPYQSLLDQHLQNGLSMLYVSVGGRLAGLILLDDPLRNGAKSFIRGLRRRKAAEIYLLTGDGEQTAGKISRELGMDGFRADLLPEDKAGFIRELKARGRTTVMVGDGMNDSPALSEADVGISMKHGADLTREVCDILLTDSRLEGIFTAMDISEQAVARIRQNYSWIVGVNSILILLGLTGRISPVMSAVLHNMTTVLVSLNSLRPLGRNKFSTEKGGSDHAY